MKTTITGFRQDEESYWVADLACGHSRHFRHNPPWQEREWVTTPEGRARFLGSEVDCVECDQPADPSARPTVRMVEIFIQGQPVQARVGETIVHALWAAGLAKSVQTGCVGGVCGACTVTVRFRDGRKGGTDLACLRPVEAGMEVYPFPVEPARAVPPLPEPSAESLRRAFPTLDRCTKCNNCTVACPMSIPVMDSVLRMQKGDFEAVAEDFTTCIHCGLCRAVCEDKVLPHTMGIWVRRSLGMTREYPSLDSGLVEGDAERAEAEWEYLLNAEPEERLRRARRFRVEGKVS